ncbi:hypothetical protein L916_08374 [Phytophthora nicotianae]|uniref:Uncharacterized protein n=1 Tax=Phytophthora nicotianae TaxID=4792 RepID=W2J495_PHYNI|nr:hypothetical protein L916_08374 [Phytophthora nicotianae]
MSFKHEFLSTVFLAENLDRFLLDKAVDPPLELGPHEFLVVGL